MTALSEVPRTTAGKTVAKQKDQFMLSSGVHIQSGFICVCFFEGQFCSAGEKSTSVFLCRCIHDRIKRLHWGQSHIVGLFFCFEKHIVMIYKHDLDFCAIYAKSRLPSSWWFSLEVWPPAPQSCFPVSGFPRVTHTKEAHGLRCWDTHPSLRTLCTL